MTAGALLARPSSGAPGAIEGAGLLAAFTLAYLALDTQGFLSAANLEAILASAALVGIAAAGLTLMILSGNLFSLSLGITASICAMTFMYTVQSGVALAIVLSLAVGASIFAVQGSVVGALGANPIVVTIGAGALQQGAVLSMTDGASVLSSAPASSYAWLTHPVAGIPVVVFFFLAIVCAVELVLRQTKLGHRIYLMGDNRRAAITAGMPVARLTTWVFAGAGLCAGAAGILLGAQSEHAELGLDGTLTFDALAAALVGGTAVTGGRGSVIRSTVGAIAIATLTDLLLLRGYSQGVQILVKGLAVVGVLALIHARSKARAT